MQKKLLTKLGRIALLFMAISGQIWIALVIFEASMTFDSNVLPSIRATIWHVRNGSTVIFDGHRFHLPAFWYPSPNEQIGGLDLQYAPLGSPALEGIHLKSLPRKVDDRTLQEQFKKNVDHLNEHSAVPHEWTLETLQGRTLTFRCIANETGIVHTLVCEGFDSNLAFAVTAGPKAHRDALNILETSE